MGEWKYLFFILTIFVRQSDSCLYNCCFCGDVFPPNAYVSVGSTLKLTCTIEEDSSFDSLVFIFNRTEESIQQSGKNSIVLRKVIQGTEDEGVYDCLKNGQKVGSTSVEVEYPLQAVNESDFVCEMLDWNLSLSCWWKIGDYRKEYNINVSIVAETMGSVYLDEHRNHAAILPVVQNRTYAIWNGPFGNPYSIQFNLTIKQTKTNESKHQTFKRKFKDIVKPASISQIYAENIARTCLTVRWENTHPNKYQVYDIFSSDEWNCRNMSKQINKTSSDKMQHSEFCGLIPYTHYKFTIRRRPVSVLGSNNQYTLTGLWSDPMSETFRTLSDVPASPPNMTSGSFTRTGGTNETVIYWKFIRPIDRHGIIANYTVTYSSLESNITWRNYSQHKNITLSINSDKWYSVSLSATTTDGYESPSLSILVPPESTVELTVPNIVVEINAERTKTWVHWEGSDSCFNYTIFWLTNNELDWITSRMNETVIPLSNLEKVGVSCLKEIFIESQGHEAVVGGGLQWTKCKYYQGKDPALPISVSVTPDKSALDVTWILPCNELVSYPLWLNVTWCDLHPSQEMCQDMSYALVDPGHKYYRIEKLNPRTKYRVRINSVSKSYSVLMNMDFADQQPEIYEYEANSSMQSLILPLTIILGICGVVFIGLYCIIRKCRSGDDMEIAVPSIIKNTRSYWSRSSEKYPEGNSMEDFKILNATQIGTTEKEDGICYNVNTLYEKKEDSCDTSDCGEVPNILEEIQRIDSGKKEKLTHQLSDNSKFILASDHTNNSEVFSQSHSLPDSLMTGSQSPFSISNNDNNQSTHSSCKSNISKSPSGPSNHNLSGPSQSETLSSGTASGTQNKSVILSSSSSSNVNETYHQIGHFEDSSSDISSYPPFHCAEFSGSVFFGQGGDSIARLNGNEDSSAGTDDELLVASSDPESSRDEKETKKKNIVPQQTVSNTTMCPSTNMQQVPIDVINQFPSSAINLSLQQVCKSAIVTNSVQDTDGEHFAFDSNESYPFASGASLTNSTSDFNDAGYKTVDLDSACFSSVQSSVYS